MTSSVSCRLHDAAAPIWEACPRYEGVFLANEENFPLSETVERKSMEVLLMKMRLCRKRRDIASFAALFV